ncbi:putative membrane protein [Bosea sp. BE125]|uniref:AzlD family protein n=1 Tax=Bosea sp. BE125 TaxID=2817909 RepID=UPI0028552FA9|nr:AzlD domain-containing protein [Bosea sp. BE125]MDR6873380.1 putative membrane protein [Bosea sp. BE125]
MTLSIPTILAIIGMAIVTYATRIGGLFFADKLQFKGKAKAKAAFDEIPAAVLVSVIAPVVLTTGPAETIAALITILAARRLPLIAIVIVGVIAVVVLRLFMS